jgi:hypothetical protein
MIPKQAAFEKRLGKCWQEFSLVWRSTYVLPTDLEWRTSALAENLSGLLFLKPPSLKTVRGWQASCDRRECEKVP